MLQYSLKCNRMEIVMDLEKLNIQNRNIAVLGETKSPVISCYINNESGFRGYRDSFDERIKEIRKALPADQRLDFEHALAKTEVFLLYPS